MSDERERRASTDSHHGFPGGPPHPPYGEPLAPAATTSPEEAIPAKPPTKRSFVVTDKRKRTEKPKKKRKEKKKPRTVAGAKDTARRLSKKQMLMSLAIAIIVLSILGRLGESSKDRRGLGAAGGFALVPKSVCEDSLDAPLDPDKEIPIAGAPTGGTPEVSGKGLGEVLWAVDLDGIVAPRTLESRLTSTNGQIVSFARPDVALFYRPLTLQGPDTNHFTAVDYKTGDIAWQKVLRGWILSTSAEHVWVTGMSDDDSSVVAALDAATGEIDACFGGHAASEEDDPPLFEVFDEQLSLAYDAGGAPIGDGILVQINSSNGDLVQRLSVRAQPERIPGGTDFYRILSATESTAIVDTFESIEGRDLERLHVKWTASEDVNNTLSDSIASPELALVHQSDYGDSTPDRRTIGLDPETGDELWRILHPGEGTLEYGGLHISGTDAVVCITDFTAEGTRTVIKTADVEREISNAYMSFARENIVALIREPIDDRPGRGTVVDLAAPGKPLAVVKKAVTILGATAEEVVVELDVDGAPWLLGISLAPEGESESESQGGGGGGGDSEQEQQQGGGGGGGQGGTGDGGEGAPDV